MNALLTFSWFAVATYASYLGAKEYFPDSVTLLTILGFIVSVIARFAPKGLDGIGETMGDIAGSFDGGSDGGSSGGSDGGGGGGD